MPLHLTANVLHPHENWQCVFLTRRDGESETPSLSRPAGPGGGGGGGRYPPVTPGTREGRPSPPESVG
jgi:hypothetical protein